jgi:hypothetical protein
MTIWFSNKVLKAVVNGSVRLLGKKVTADSLDEQTYVGYQEIVAGLLSSSAIFRYVPAVRT